MYFLSMFPLSFKPAEMESVFRFSAQTINRLIHVHEDDMRGNQKNKNVKLSFQAYVGNHSPKLISVMKVVSVCLVLGIASGCASQIAVTRDDAAKKESAAQQNQSESSDTTGLKIPDSVHMKHLTAPGLGYLKARKNLQNPGQLLGGGIQVRISHDSGAIHAALADHRRLDPRVFGDSAQPRGFGGSPVVYGVPPVMRSYDDTAAATITTTSAFAGKTMMMPQGRMRMEAFDITATDAKTTRDSVRFIAMWRDSAGNSYSVRCDKVSPFGVQYPVFGGVVTNHILYGISRIGTPLMPTAFVYVGFWGEGQVLKNDSLLDEEVMVHGVLMEFVRTEDYELAFDHQVNPRKRQFHVMVLPYEADGDRFVARPVNTGFILPDGNELPFWHLTFGNLDIRSRRLESQVRSREKEQFPQGPPEKPDAVKPDTNATQHEDSVSTKNDTTGSKQESDTASTDTSIRKPKSEREGSRGDLIPDDTVWSSKGSPYPESGGSENSEPLRPDTVSADSMGADTIAKDSGRKDSGAQKAGSQKSKKSDGGESESLVGEKKLSTAADSTEKGAESDAREKKAEQSTSARADTREQPADSMQEAAAETASATESTTNSTSDNPPVVVLMTDDLQYQPVGVTITVGQTIQWRNVSELVHTVTMDPRMASDPKNARLPKNVKPFNSGNIAPEETFEHTFTVPGDYTYFCIPHEGADMVGEVVVKPPVDKR